MKNKIGAVFCKSRNSSKIMFSVNDLERGKLWFRQSSVQTGEMKERGKLRTILQRMQMW